jgi:acetylornithine deacetylase/succinyl-diaminopimelate desuccinylase-like protein
MGDPATAVDRAIAAAEAAWPATRARLEALVRIPSCSFPGFDPAHVAASAAATAAWLSDSGYPEVQVVPGGGPHPAVLAADRRAGPDAPTLLLYAHHDVQPPLREELWTTAPFAPSERDGRLYARGAADDKAGVMLHAAAAAAWNASAGRPPVNLAVLIEGEEEIGSPHFSAFLEQHLDRLRADGVVIADGVNFAAGLPSITTSLRGNLVLEVELAALRGPLHSGLWGGAVPDCVQALMRLLAGLHASDGRIAVPGLTAGVVPPSVQETADWQRLPWDAGRFAAEAGILEPAAVPADRIAALRALWREPALTINAVQAGARGQTGNVVMDRAWARLSLRIAPGQDPAVCAAALLAHLRAACPAGMRLELTPRGEPGAAWTTDTAHPLFAACRAALRRGYGADPVAIGCGASIPFVGEITARLGGVPALIVGVEDPASAAHAENESLHLGDALAALRAETALFGLMRGLP